MPQQWFGIVERFTDQETRQKEINGVLVQHASCPEMGPFQQPSWADLVGYEHICQCNLE